MVRILCITIGLALVTGLFAFQQNSVLKALDDTSYQMVSPAFNFEGGILDYSGMVYDKFRHKILSFGGGHATACADHVVEYDIETLTWKNLYQTHTCPFFEDQSRHYAPPAGHSDWPYGGTIDINGEVRPTSRHTYDGLDMLPDTNLMIMMTGQEAACYCAASWLWGERYVWVFDPVAVKWTRLSPDAPGYAGATCVDPATGLMYEIMQGKLRSYDWKTQVKTALTATPPNTYDKPFTYSDADSCLYFFTETLVYRYNPRTGASVTLTPSGLIPNPHSHNVVFDNVNKVFCIFFSGAFYYYSPRTNTWYNIPYDVSRFPNNPSFHHHIYDPVDNVHLVVGSDKKTYAYKFSDRLGRFTGTGTVADMDTTEPSAITGLKSVESTSFSVTLSWNAATENESGVAGYTVYRDDIRIAETTDTVFVCPNLTEKTAYGFTVSAVNNWGVEGVKSAPLSVTTSADLIPPVLSGASAFAADTVVAVFSEKVSPAGATAIGNYTIPGITITRAALQSDSQSVVLAVSPLSPGIDYTLSVQGIADRAQSPNTMNVPSAVHFRYFASPLRAVEDAFVRGGTYASANYGRDTLLTVKSGDPDFTRTVYVRFNIAGCFPSGVGSAYLKLTVVSTDATSAFPLAVCGVTSDSWSESALNWGNAPSPAAVVTTVSVLPKTGATILFDVTSLLKTQMPGDTLLSLCIKDPAQSNKAVSFASKDRALGAPELVLSATPPAAPELSEPLSAQPLLTARPAPFNAAVTLQWHGENINGDLIIRDIRGCLVKKLPLSHSRAVWNAGGAAAGIYLAELKTHGRAYRTRLILAR